MSGIDRRQFLRWGVSAGAAVPALSALKLFAQESWANRVEVDRKYYERLPGNREGLYPISHAF